MRNTAELQIIGIDTEEGIACCADDPEFYEEMLEEFVQESQQQIKDLVRFYEARDWKNYGIRAHSIKSSSRMIGAKRLSEMARTMEAAAKAGDGDAVDSSHLSFLAEYEKTSAAIRNWLETSARE